MFLSTYHAPLLGCTQNHSCMGSLPDSSAVREESGTETTILASFQAPPSFSSLGTGEPGQFCVEVQRGSQVVLC